MVFQLLKEVSFNIKITKLKSFNNTKFVYQLFQTRIVFSFGKNKTLQITWFLLQKFGLTSQVEQIFLISSFSCFFLFHAESKGAENYEEI